MNILKRELKANLKVFIFWIIGLFVLLFAGMTKFSGMGQVAGGADVNAVMSKFPKVVLAVFGMVGVDVASLPGYYAILAYYVLICAVIYGIQLGVNAAVKEINDKTYEFIFTKPCSRSYVLGIKIAASWFNLILFIIFEFVFSLLAVAFLDTGEQINQVIFLYAVSILLVSSLFFSLAVFLSIVIKEVEKGMLYTNLIFLSAFVMAIVYDMLENGRVIKVITPFKYFEAKDLVKSRLDGWYVLVCMALSMVLLTESFVKFKKKDLK
ncbi:ABC transporter permease subunit [Anaeromicropila populeti]|uniref:ABC-2 type transport system permease protein n=1 Tax=Anaeromicropila populeti TaxID=37658 RepID=A0A1I6J1S6_9FIRM|nr:ABC transporter permease subunit [Anaeromicropila populeti]SFR72952.1 ABC-2 type transport system permease protein [Anaeromicropila populeti]